MAFIQRRANSSERRQQLAREDLPEELLAADHQARFARVRLFAEGPPVKKKEIVGTASASADLGTLSKAKAETFEVERPIYLKNSGPIWNHW